MKDYLEQGRSYEDKTDMWAAIFFLVGVFVFTWLIYQWGYMNGSEVKHDEVARYKFNNTQFMSRTVYESN